MLVELVVRLAVDLDIGVDEVIERRAVYDLAEQARARGESSSSHFTTMNMIDEVIEKIIPHDPFNRRHALSEPLSNVFRFHKGRLRICWIGSSAQRHITILFVSETLRKAGDASDPYRIFTNMVMSGDFDEFFDKLGVKRPFRGGAKSPIVN